MPALEFLNSVSVKVQATYAKLLTYFCQQGWLRRDRHHQWQGKGRDDLYAFKDNASQTRLVHTTAKGGLVVVLFGFGGKKEDDIDERYVLRAMRMRDEFRSRMTIIEQRSQQRRYRP